MSLIDWLAPIFCFLVAIGMAQWIRKNASIWGLVDKPNPRSSHVMPTPRGGGVGIVVAFEIVALICAIRGVLSLQFTLALTFGGGFIALIGFMDDRQSVAASVRFTVHLVMATLVAVLIYWPPVRLIQTSNAGFAVLSIAILVGATNSFNFMDGIDGLAASQAAFMAGAAAFLNVLFAGPESGTTLLISLASASLGFLMLNWPPAKIFMGDGTSGFLGFTLALLAVAPFASPSVTLPVWMILGGLFVADASLTLLRRLARGEPIFQAHRLHAYQHLARRWNGHLPVTCGYSVVNIIWLLPWSYVAARYPQSMWWVIPVSLGPVIFLLLLAGAGRREVAPVG